MKNEPITREEILLNAVAAGEAANLEPITREEMFLAKLGGADVKIPTPITRKEQFLQKAIEGGGTPGGGGGGSEEEWIGDGNTHIWIHLEEGRTSPMLGVCPNGTVTVDWGDGTEPDILTGLSTTVVRHTPKHEYAKPGDYVITLAVDGEMGFCSTSTYGAPLRIGNNDKRNNAYWSAIQMVEMGNNITGVEQYAFYNCYKLKSVVIPDSVTKIGSNVFSNCCSLQSIVFPSGLTSIGSTAFSNCYSLQSIVFPSGLTSIGGYAFSNCPSLACVVIPGGVTSISSMAFSSCGGVRFYDFTNHNAVPQLSDTTVFNNIATDCEIRVPAALADEWKAETNWATYANKIVGV